MFHRLSSLGVFLIMNRAVTRMFQPEVADLDVMVRA